MKNFLLFVSIVLLLGWLSACSGATPAAPSSPEESEGLPKEPAHAPPPSAPEELAINPPTSAATAGPLPRELVEKARLDLSESYDIDLDQIDVAEARAVDWPDTSLGCPQPDMAYAAVITPGYWILLEAQGVLYPYHTDLGEQVILCLGNASDSGIATPPLPSIPVNPNEIKDGIPWMPVD